MSPETPSIKTPREASERDSDLRSRASPPPGELCQRCRGLLIHDYTTPTGRDITGRPETLQRCVNCGNCMDPDILANRGKRPRETRESPDRDFLQRTAARKGNRSG